MTPAYAYGKASFAATDLNLRGSHAKAEEDCGVEIKNVYAWGG